MKRFLTGFFVCLFALFTGMCVLSCSADVSASLSFGETSFLPSRNGDDGLTRWLIGISVKSDGGYYEARSMDVTDKIPAVIFDGLPVDSNAEVAVRCFEFRPANPDSPPEDPVGRNTNYDSMNFYGEKSLVIGEGENRIGIGLTSVPSTSNVRKTIKSTDGNVVFSFFTPGDYYCILDNQYNQCSVGLYEGSFEESGTVCLYETAYKRIEGQTDGTTNYSDSYNVIRNPKKNEVQVVCNGDDAATGPIYSFSFKSRNGKTYTFNSVVFAD